jgi:hypothetical protein
MGIGHQPGTVLAGSVPSIAGNARGVGEREAVGDVAAERFLAGEELGDGRGEGDGGFGGR